MEDFSREFLMSINNSTIKNILFDEIHFSVEELKSIQKSNEPFTIDELKKLLDEELSRPINEMNTNVVEFLIDKINGYYLMNM